ncbi:hypothetical protein PaG_06544 [Moesziomyces aphidis]|uniref:LysM domain-containing protein n=1 Tax=Moesziomyces aphidis TaxID=84754 RepID=W3VDL5_MOEAP|nr:hypothetical protein PaG_06544 [Moesziomyces aphidis]
MRVSTALLSLAALPWLARAAFHSNDTACTRHYTVEAGDTCDRIGQKTLTSTYQILAFNLLNAGADCYTLEIGSQLCLGRYGNDCQFVHRCSNSDTCESIANDYGISTHRLQDNNPSLDCNIVYEGLMLCVSAGSIRPPADHSINSTDVKVAREVARQAWIVQEQQKHNAKQAEHMSASAHSASKKNPSQSKQRGKQHHKQADAKQHDKQHHEQADAKHHHQHQQPKGDKPKQAPDARQHAAKPAPHDSKPGDQAHASAAQDGEHRGTQDGKSTPRAASMDALEEIAEDFTAAALAGSNHTPHSTEHHTPPPLDGATHSAHKRHRSLSSRSHQQSSHTH